MSTIDTRREQMFPKLEPREIDRLRRFGEVRRYAAGEALFVTGEIAPGMFVLIKGSVRVTRRDPLGHSAPIVEQGPGEFVAEVGQLSGQPALRRRPRDRRRGSASDPVRKFARPDDRRARARRTDHAGTDPASRRPGRGRCRRSGADWPRIQSGRDSPARLPGPQCVPASIARSRTGSRRGGTGQTICPESRGPAAGRVSERLDPEKSRARPNWRAHSEWCRSTNGIEPTTSRSSARDPLASRPRSMPHRRVSR